MSDELPGDPVPDRADDELARRGDKPTERAGGPGQLADRAPLGKPTQPTGEPDQARGPHRAAEPAQTAEPGQIRMPGQIREPGGADEAPPGRARDPESFYNPPTWLDDQPEWLDDAPQGDSEEPWWLDEQGPLDPEGDDREWIEWEASAAEAVQTDADEGQALARELGFEDAYLHTKGMPSIPGIKEGPAGGFEQGEILDQAPPSLVLAGHADYASGENRDFPDVTDDQLAGLLYARRRLLAWQAWERLMAIGEYIRRRPAPEVEFDEATRMPACWDQTLAGEIHLQLAITRREADRLLGLAWDLIVKLRTTSAKLRDGIIDEDKASTISYYCANLTLDEARRAEDILYAVGDDIEMMTWGMIRDRIARAVIEVNPDAARKRRESAARERRIETGPEISGNAMIAGRELPPAVVLAMDQELTARARILRKLGAEGGMNELRVQAFLERWGLADPEADLGRRARSAASHHDGQDGADRDGNSGRGPRPGGPFPTGPFPTGPVGPGSGGCACGRTSGALAGQIHLTAPVSTFTKRAERPGVLRGFGPIDPDLVRDLADAASRHPGTSYHFTVTGTDGRPVAHACGRPGPGDPAGRRKRDISGRPDPRGRPDRNRPGEYWPPGQGPGPGTGITEPGSREPRSPEPRSPEPGSPEPGSPERGSPERARLEVIDRGPPGALGTWRYTHGNRVIIFEFEELTRPCDHRFQAAGHDPGKLLRHLTGVLNQTCTNPGCRRPEAQCDYEHSRPWEKGGITCLCAAAPVCRRDHRDKQQPGWKIEGTGIPGWFTWIVPSGRKYPSKPTIYPV